MTRSRWNDGTSASQHQHRPPSEVALASLLSLALKQEAPERKHESHDGSLQRRNNKSEELALVAFRKQSTGARRLMVLLSGS